MTGFIPAGEGQYMQMCESTGLHLSIKEFRADEGQSTEEKVWDIGPDGTVREPRGLDFASQEEPYTKGHCHPRASSAKTRRFHTQLDEGPETP